MAITLGAAPVKFAVGTSTTCPVTISATAGRALLFAVSYRDPPGTNPITSVASSGGETVTALGTLNANSEGARRRFYIIPSVTSTGSLTITPTWASAVYAVSNVWELIGINSSSYLDVANQVNGSYSGGGGTNPTMSLVTTAANSAIFAICDSSGVEPGVDTGYTLTALDNYYQYCEAQYLLDAGAAGTKTVQMTAGSFTEWGLSAVAIKVFVSPPTEPNTVSADTITANSLRATWTDASSDETGFKVQTSPSPYSSWTDAPASPAAANATNLTVTGLAPGTTYKVRVASTNAGGDSSWATSAGEFTTPSLTKAGALLLGVG